MPRIVSTVEIFRPIEVVYDYLTTAGNWPKWHPSSLAVAGATDHSLQVGEQVVEDYRVAGRPGRVTWTVTERVPPRRWTIVGDVQGGGGGGTVSYSLGPAGDRVHFVREFVYEFPPALEAILDVEAIRRQVQDESDTAVRQLKAVLEAAEK